jgi:hypothetical protein
MRTFASAWHPWNLSLKTVTTTIQSDATLNNDSDLAFPMAAGAKYIIRAMVFFTSDATADFKWRITGPASPTFVKLYRKNVNPDTLTALRADYSLAYSAADVVPGFTAGTDGIVEWDALVHNGTTAGDFVFQWSQNSSNASNTSVQAGSYIEWMVVP